MQRIIIDPKAPQEERQVVIYYKYVDIENPEKFAEDHLKWCKENDIKGRILVTKVGVNGTCSGTPENIQKYKEMMWADPRFADLWFKDSEGDQFTFTKIFVRVKEELVTLRVPGLDVAKNAGQHVTPEEFNKMVENDPDVVVVDMRNLYEYELGHFQGAIPMKMDSFRELPEAAKAIEHYKDKKIVAYCTSGVRCEPATAYLRSQGFNNLYQLSGGIQEYGRECPDRLWEGSLFVFDRRVSVPINKTKNLIVAKCLHCSELCDVYINCVNAECNALFICCELCAGKMENSCSEACMSHKRDPNKKDYMSMIQRRYASRREETIKSN